MSLAFEAADLLLSWGWLAVNISTWSWRVIWLYLTQKKIFYALCNMPKWVFMTTTQWFMRLPRATLSYDDCYQYVDFYLSQELFLQFVCLPWWLLNKLHSNIEKVFHVLLFPCYPSILWIVSNGLYSSLLSSCLSMDHLIQFLLLRPTILFYQVTQAKYDAKTSCQVIFLGFYVIKR